MDAVTAEKNTWQQEIVEEMKTMIRDKKIVTPKKAKRLSQRKIVKMAHEIGLPGNTRIHEIAKAYALRLGLNPVGNNNKKAREFLYQISEQNIEITGVVKFVSKSRNNKFADCTIKNESSTVQASHAFINSKEFLSSYEWRSLRMRVLKKYGRKCACCGATPESGSVMHVDHIKPRRKYPELALDENNLQVLCEDCNHGKGNWDETDWRSVNTSCSK